MSLDHGKPTTHINIPKQSLTNLTNIWSAVWYVASSNGILSQLFGYTGQAYTSYKCKMRCKNVVLIL